MNQHCPYVPTDTPNIIFSLFIATVLFSWTNWTHHLQRVLTPSSILPHKYHKLRLLISVSYLSSWWLPLTHLLDNEFGGFCDSFWLKNHWVHSRLMANCLYIFFGIKLNVKIDKIFKNKGWSCMFSIRLWKFGQNHAVIFTNC